MRSHCIAMSLLFCVGWAAQSPAAIIFFTDRPAWESAVDNFATETFPAPIPGAAVITFDGGIRSTVFNGADQRVLTVGPGDVGPPNFDLIGETMFLSNVGQNGGTGQTVWEFPHPIHAFGADFFEPSTGGGLEIAGDFDGSGFASYPLTDFHPQDGFVGLVSDAWFSELTFVAGGLEAFFAEDVVISGSIPEPTSALCFGVGLGVAVLSMRRRTRVCRSKP